MFALLINANPKAFLFIPTHLATCCITASTDTLVCLTWWCSHACDIIGIFCECMETWMIACLFQPTVFSSPLIRLQLASPPYSPSSTYLFTSCALVSFEKVSDLVNNQREACCVSHNECWGTSSSTTFVLACHQLHRGPKFIFGRIC